MSLESSQQSVSQPSVLFIAADAAPEKGCRLYRCAYQSKQLQRAGLHVETVYYADATDEMVNSADVLIVSRCLWDERTAALIGRARTQGKLVCGDLDDRIYAPWDADASGYLRSRGGVRPLRVRTVAADRAVLHLLPMFDVVLTSTHGIKSELEELGLSAHVMPNAFDTDVARPVARERRGLSRMLLMTGTRTHDADLRMIAPQLARFLHENPAISCTFLGPFERNGWLGGLPNIETKELLPVEQLYEFVAWFDLCLVPLEDTPFNDCKSPIKFIECGLVSVPVLASARREFRALINHGENGFLAGDDEDAWYRALCELRDAPHAIRKAAAAAHREVTAAHTVESRGRALADYLLAQLEELGRSSARRTPGVRTRSAGGGEEAS
jgi:glycosyltransferase involved in cell wall biosynthesis